MWNRMAGITQQLVDKAQEAIPGLDEQLVSALRHLRAVVDPR